MPQPSHQDTEEGNHQDDHPEQPQSAQNQQLRSHQGESNFGDSSGALFSIYSKNAEEEDNKMADRWQKDADGILIFTGLFSAAVAALLAVAVQDLRPNPQDISAFYLANIYQVLADPNVTIPTTSIPSPVQPPPFSPPRYAIWVNSLWFLSLVISLTCALSATSLHQWARRYIRLTQPARCSSEKRARIRAFFAGGVDKMHVPWAVETLPALIHLSLFLFFSGLVIFLLNVNHSVFLSVIWWMGFFAIVYGCVTFLPIFRPESPYYTPLSTPASFITIHISSVIMGVVNLILSWFVWVGVALCAILYYGLTPVWMIISSCGKLSRSDNDPEHITQTHPMWVYQRQEIWIRLMEFPDRMKSHFDRICIPFRRWADRISNRAKAVDEITSNRSSEIDLGIFRWTIGILGDDDTLEKFFDAIPGFFNSKLVKITRRDIPRRIEDELRAALNGFFHRTLSSNSVIESVKNRRVNISLNVADVISHYDVYKTLRDIVTGEFGQIPQSIETAHILAHWCYSNDGYIALVARCLVGSILQAVRKRDDHWVALARDQLGIPEHVLRDVIAHDDNSVSVSILIHMARQVVRTHSSNAEFLWSLSKFDIRNTDPRLQHEFCAFWNEMVLEAKRKGFSSRPVHVLHSIRHLYIALHQGTDASPTAFDASTPNYRSILYWPTTYPRCDIAAHHTDSTIPPSARHAFPHPPRLESQPSPAGSTPQQQAEEVNIDIVPGHPSPSYHRSRADHLTTDPFIQLELSSADLTANILRPDESTPDIPINEIRETSSAPTPTLLDVPLPDPLSVTVTPRPPSVSVQQPDSNKQQDEAPPQAESAIMQVSSAANQIPDTIPNISIALQTSEESTGVLPTVSGSLSSPTMIPAPLGGVIPMELSSPIESALVQPGFIPHPPGALPSLATMPSDSTPRVSIALDAHITRSIGGSSTHDNTGDLAHSTSMEVSRHADQLSMPNLDIAEHTVPLGDRQHD